MTGAITKKLVVKNANLLSCSYGGQKSEQVSVGQNQGFNKAMFLSRGSRGRSVSLSSPASRGSLRSLARRQ